MALGILTASEDDQVERQLSEWAAADAAQLCADPFLGGLQFLADQTGVTISLGLLSEFVLIGAWSYTSGLYHALPCHREAWVRVVVAELEQLCVGKPALHLQSSFPEILSVDLSSSVSSGVHMGFR